MNRRSKNPPCDSGVRAKDPNSEHGRIVVRQRQRPPAVIAQNGVSNPTAASARSPVADLAKANAGDLANRTHADAHLANPAPAGARAREHADYKVGYKKPPMGRPYKKGQTGNPRGRPKGSRNLRTILEEESRKLVEVTEKGRTRKISMWELSIKVLISQMAKGDLKAMTIYHKLLEKARLLDPDDRSSASIEAEDSRHSEMNRIILEYFGVSPVQDPTNDTAPPSPTSEGPNPEKPVVH